jgi:uncharacterized membrane protein YbhN (UPF0104 family)
MSPIVRLSAGGQIKKIVGMRVGNEIVFEFINFIFIIFDILILFIDFGFDIKELISALSSVALPAVTLTIVSRVFRDCSLPS